jgi:type II secretory pathway pseudopilin PulG
MNMRHFCPNRQRRLARFPAAFTFIENVFAMAIIAIFFVAVFALNTQCLYLLNSGRGAAFATESMQDRLEQLRNCTWSQLTDASYIQSSVLNSSTNGMQNLGQVTETVTVNAYPTPLTPPTSVVRSNGSASTVSSNASIANGDMVRVDVVLAWTRLGNRARTEAMTTVIAKNNP